MIKLVKKISQSGICSRREATRLILSGQVSVNDTRVEIPSQLINETKDVVRVKGKVIQIQSPELWMFHKPVGVITSHYDPHHEKTIFDLLPKNLKHSKIVGRLDLMTSGLLLLTNQSQIQTYLEHPKHAISRIYHVRVFGKLPKDLIVKLKKGIEIEGFYYDGIGCKILKSGNQNHVLELVLEEGKNREIRKIMALFDLKVSKLHRVAYGDFNLDHLKIGKIKAVSQTQIQTLLREIDAHH